MKKIYVDWLIFGLLIDELVSQIKKDRIKFDGVYGIPRGGLPIAVSLSHRLNLPLLVCPTKNSLVCDDISDTGITLSTVKHKKIACLYSTPWTKVIPHYWEVLKYNENDWIVFPWEDKKNENKN